MSQTKSLEKTGGFAGFLPRLGAFGWDYLPVAAWVLAVLAGGLAAKRFSPALRGDGLSSALAGEALGLALVTLPVSLYFALSEASPRQATWGKRKMGLKVTGDGGQRLSIARSLGRTALKFIPWELAHAAIWQGYLGAGFESAWFTALLSLCWMLVGANLISLFLSPRRQALYDRLAGTLVLRDASP